MRGWIGRVWWDGLMARFRKECADCERYFFRRLFRFFDTLVICDGLAFGCVALGWERYCCLALVE